MRKVEAYTSPSARFGLGHWFNERVKVKTVSAS